MHFDLLDLTELTDMSDQELAEVFADSDDESLASESPAGGLMLGCSVWCGAVLGPEPTKRSSPQTPILENNCFPHMCQNQYWSLYHFIHYSCNFLFFLVTSIPNVRLELMTPISRIACSSN